jgi:ABC-type glutathione transport system ATPase component
MSRPLLEMRDVCRTFRAEGRTVQAARGITLTLARGEMLGIVGESGSGKSTIGRIAVGLERHDSGRIALDGVDLGQLSARARRKALLQCQMVFQDPYSSLNPRLAVGRQVAEGLSVKTRLGRAELRDRIAALFERVGLSPDQMDRYPHEFSGGQRQRVAIARALAPGPALIVADEPVSALDLTIQAQIIELLAETQRAEALAFLFISHDISVVARLCDRVAVIYRGRIVEEGPAAAVIGEPRHPYTRNLLAAVPRLDHRRTGAGRTLLPVPQHGDADIFRDAAPGHRYLVAASQA